MIKIKVNGQSEIFAIINSQAAVDSQMSSKFSRPTTMILKNTTFLENAILQALVLQVITHPVTNLVVSSH